MEFEDFFRGRIPDMTPADVASILGPPKVIDDTIVPLGSGWGMQEGLKYKSRAGETVLQWTYLDDKHDYVVLFAKPLNAWILTLRFSLPRGLASDRACE